MLKLLFVLFLITAGIVLFIVKKEMSQLKKKSLDSGPKKNKNPLDDLYPKDEQGRYKITLEKIAARWQAEQVHDKTIVKLQTLATLWREKEDLLQDIAVANATDSYESVTIADFYRDEVQNKPYFIGMPGAVVRQILKMLDTQGDCSSVVQSENAQTQMFRSLSALIPGEGDRRETTVYDLLANVNLRTHSVNVARKIIEMTEGTMRAKAIIAALGHDIGKMPICTYDELYRTHDHPARSLLAMQKDIKGFMDLQYYEDVSDAIKNHMGQATKILCQKVKEADHKARTKELLDALNWRSEETAAEQAVIRERIEQVEREAAEQTAAPAEAAAIESPRVQREEQPVSPSRTSSPPPRPAGRPRSPSGGQLPDIFRDVDRTRREQMAGSQQIPQVIDVPGLDIDAVLQEVGAKINVVSEQGHWVAFSFNMVAYIQPDTLWEAVKSTTVRINPEILFADNDRERRKNIIYTVVSKLWDRHVIEQSLIKKKYFSAPFTVVFNDETRQTATYTPIKLGAFECLESEIEGRKTGRLLAIAGVEVNSERKQQQQN